MEKFLSQRENSLENTNSLPTQRSDKIFPIRRDISEIPELNQKTPFQLTLPTHKTTKSMVDVSTLKSTRTVVTFKAANKPESPNRSSTHSKAQTKFQNYFKTKGLFNNYVIRKENPNKKLENCLNSSITDMVQKNNKTLEEIMKYSNQKRKKSKEFNDFFNLLTDDISSSNKTARIMYLHKSKKRNYSNSDLLDSNQKVSLKSVIASFKKQVQNYNSTEEESERKRLLSFDFLSRRSSINSDKPRKLASSNTNLKMRSVKMRSTLQQLNKQTKPKIEEFFNPKTTRETDSGKNTTPLEIYFKKFKK